MLSDNPYDGLIINIVSPEPSAREKAIRRIHSFTTTPQIVICTTTHPFVYEGLLKQYEAVKKLLECSDDPHFIEELEVFGEDIQKRIQGAVYTMYSCMNIASFGLFEITFIRKRIDYLHQSLDAILKNILENY